MDADREMGEALRYYGPPVDPMTKLVLNVNHLLAQSDGQREVNDAILRSVLSAMRRFAPERQVELLEPVSLFVADPVDYDVMARLGALLRDAPRPGR